MHSFSALKDKGGTVRLLILVFISIGLAGCGPEQTSRDAENSEMESIVAEQKAALKNFEGIYEGVAKTWNGKTSITIRLHITQFSLLQPSTTRYDFIEIPNLVAFMQLLDENDLGMLRGFTQGRYSVRENILQMYGGPVGLIPFNFLRVALTGTSLVGDLWSGKIISRVEFKRLN